MEKFQRVCKLCRNIVEDKNFTVIDDEIKHIFVALLLKSIFDNESQDVMCGVCSDKLHTAFDFKTACLTTDNIILPYVDFEIPTPVLLEDIYEKEKGKLIDHVLEPQEICRLCFKPISGEHKSILEVSLDSIQIYIPEINFALTSNPGVCTKCFDSLKLHSSFIKSSSFVEELSISKHEVGDINGTNIFIKTEEIEIKSEEIDQEKPVEILYYDIKKEESEQGDTSLYCSTGLTDTKKVKTKQSPSQVQMFQCDKCTFKSKYSKSIVTHQLTHKDPSELQMHKCPLCKFETKFKGNLVSHQMRHKNPSLVRMYNCNQCDYKSIYKMNVITHKLQHKDPLYAQMHKCDKCDYANINKRNLKRHQLIHKDPSEVQTYMCSECSYKSIDKDNLRQHLLRHRDPSQVEMHVCDQCGFATKYKRSFTQHQVMHQDPSRMRLYKCDQCDFATKHKHILKPHQLIHKDPTELPMYKCAKCKFKTKRKKSLVRHQSRHRAPLKSHMTSVDTQQPLTSENVQL